MVSKIEHKNMTLKELRAEAKAKKIKGYSRMGKEKLLTDLLGHTSVKKAPPLPPKPKAVPKVVAPTKTTHTPQPARCASTKEAIGDIQNDVPIPNAKSEGKYPLEDLHPGESFLVECSTKTAKKVRLNIMNVARRVAKKTGAAFLVLVQPEEKGVRCWRTDAPEPIPLVDEVVPVVQPTQPATGTGAPEPATPTAQPESPGPAPIAAPDATSFKLNII